MTKTSPAQRRWMRHLAKTGDTKAIPTNTFLALLREGLVERKLGAIYLVSAKGREALERDSITR